MPWLIGFLFLLWALVAWKMIHEKSSTLIFFPGDFEYACPESLLGAVEVCFLETLTWSQGETADLFNSIIHLFCCGVASTMAESFSVQFLWRQKLIMLVTVCSWPPPTASWWFQWECQSSWSQPYMLLLKVFKHACDSESSSDHSVLLFPPTL